MIILQMQIHKMSVRSNDKSFGNIDFCRAQWIKNCNIYIILNIEIILEFRIYFGNVSMQSRFMAFVLNILHMCCVVIQIHKWLKLLRKTILKFINISNMKYKSIHCSSILLFERWSSRDGVREETEGELLSSKNESWILDIFVDENGTLTMRNDLCTWLAPSNYLMKTVLTNTSKPDEADKKRFHWLERMPRNHTMNGNHKCHESLTANHITIAVSWAVKIFSIWLISLWTEKRQNWFIACGFYALSAFQSTVPIL